MGYARYTKTFTAKEVSSHVLNGNPFAIQPFYRKVVLAAKVTGTSAGANMTIQVGNRIEVNDQALPFNASTAEPVYPDDFHFAFLVGPNEQIVVNFRETGNVATTTAVLVAKDAPIPLMRRR